LINPIRLSLSWRLTVNSSAITSLGFVLLFSLGFLNNLSAKTVPDGKTPTYYVYLAGPEVFLPDPIAAGVQKKAIIQSLNEKHKWPFKLVGLYPMDNEIENFAADFSTGINIYKANIALMEQAHFITANMVRFRGPSMDVGTAFEMGYMNGLGKPVFAYYDAKPFYGSDEKPGIYAERVKKHYTVSKTQTDKDSHGQTIEDFQMADNLMMVGSLYSANGEIALNFESVILQIAESIKAKSEIKLNSVD